ncbi:hypothetical protein [Oscillatoria salina]|uniref:hypothetical protein n=1 Tax=Oscillatoria salina TaxID=331517 RepID=UPI0013B88B07|nr:hypothetical protein [Oscillatoria salina]MBZ8182405.1 hypothetical protein [Oscillatoria salina IIICB1]NET88507.1 hypothetical protein [Kamptonema sp. SIO1D9]
MNPSEELRHLSKGVEPGEEEKRKGFIVWFRIQCPRDANNVLNRCRKVLQIVLRQSKKNWLSYDDEEWRTLLPEWFVAYCAPERTQEEDDQLLERWQKLSPEAQMLFTEEQKWTISEFISWLEPKERPWFWWDAFVESDNVFHLAVEVVDFPFPWDALCWLVRASGATTIQKIL